MHHNQAPLVRANAPDPDVAAELAAFLAAHPDRFDVLRTSRITQEGEDDRMEIRLPEILKGWAIRRAVEGEVIAQTGAVRVVQRYPRLARRERMA